MKYSGFSKLPMINF